MENTVRVTALHKLPFNEALFKEDAGDLDDKEFRDQCRKNWENAWLVVVEFDGPEEDLEFASFGLGVEPGDEDNQGVWEEKVLKTSPSKTRAAFYLHHVDPKKTLWYGDEPLVLPPPTAAPKALLDEVPYCSPD
ncbi:MAG: hypothetical protein HYR85_05020 [Planctomycetes bacterium]|nr:hypothetical protein [Planctomycetota bacterium]MBI3843444.1 hypothetical protein [Planctomycetota bacterium]